MKKILLALSLSVLALGSAAVWAQGPPAHTIKLTWTDSNIGTTAYKVYRSATTGTETLYATVNAPSLTYVDATPLPGFNFYKVTAVVGGIESSASNEVSAQIPVPPTVTLSVQ